MNKLIPQWGNKMTEDEAWDELERKQAKKWMQYAFVPLLGPGYQSMDLA